MITRELSLSMEASLMIHVMSLHQPTWTMIAKELSLKILRY